MALEQNILIQAIQVGGIFIAHQHLGDAAHFIAFAVVFRTIGKSRVDGNGKYGFLFLGCHGVILDELCQRRFNFEPKESTIYSNKLVY